MHVSDRRKWHARFKLGKINQFTIIFFFLHDVSLSFWFAFWLKNKQHSFVWKRVFKFTYYYRFLCYIFNLCNLLFIFLLIGSTRMFEIQTFNGFTFFDAWPDCYFKFLFWKCLSTCLLLNILWGATQKLMHGISWNIFRV